MFYYWKRNLPVVMVSVLVLVVCMLGCGILPVSSWLLFLAWGAVYTVLFAVAMWLFVLDEGERAALVARLPFLK